MTDAEGTDVQGARDALLLIPYGVYIATTGGGSMDVGAFTASWLMQVSFEPLLVALAVDKASHSHALLEENGNFTINLVDQSKTQLANRLGTPYSISPFKFNGVSWREGTTGAPILEDALAYIECEVTDYLDPDGDHSIIIGQVLAGAVNRREALLMLEQSGLRYR